jgi:hypothetical protein
VDQDGDDDDRKEQQRKNKDAERERDAHRTLFFCVCVLLNECLFICVMYSFIL